jgi:signal transduction histidine kinase
MNKRLLFVDDEPEVLRGLERMLHSLRSEWDMTFTSDPFEAERLLSEQKWDVAVLDIAMPTRSGLELLADAKESSEKQSAEFIMLTGIRDHSLKREALDLGAADLLNKPIQSEDLIARLRSVLHTKGFRDILEVHNMELQNSLDLSQGTELVGIISTGLIHDIRNILLVIMTGSNLVEMRLRESIEKTTEDLARIQQAAEHVEKLLAQIVDLSRPHAPVRDLCDVSDIARSVIEMIKPVIPITVEVELRLDENVPRVTADPTQLRQMLLNLCLNAVKALGGEGKLQLSVASVTLDKIIRDRNKSSIRSVPHVKIEVLNTQGLIEKSIHERVFESYFTTNRGSGGSGIGLSVVERIAKLHGGLVSASSSPDRGTSFVVHIPVSTQEGTAESSE